MNKANCIFCNSKINLSRENSKTCGSILCIRLLLFGIHKEDNRKDNSLILYLVNRDPKLKVKLKAMSNKKIDKLISIMKRDFLKLYRSNKKTIGELKQGD